MHKRLIIGIMTFCMLLVSSAAMAEDGGDTWSEGDAWGTETLAPMHLMLDPVIETYLGVRVVDIDGSRRAGEYDFLHTRPVGGFLVHSYPLPHRLDAEFDFTDEKMMKAELSYAYKDIILLNYTMRGLWHNLDHEVFPEGPGFFNGSNDLAPGYDYGVGITDNKVYLRLKWPDNPYHLFASFRDFNKEGDIQQRYMVGWFSTGLQKYAQLRHITWNTRTYAAGGNGHFGPVELEYVHGVKDFDAKDQTELRSAYPAVFLGPPPPLRAAGVYSHNAIPDLLRISDAVKMHTSYTGRVVGSATYYHSEKWNSLNASAVEANRASTAWTFIPFNGMTVALRYRFDSTEVFNQTIDRDFDHLTGTFVRTIPLPKSVSYRKHVGDAIVKYSPMKGVNIKASYRFEHVDKDHIYEWHVTSLGLSPPDTSQKHTAKLFAWLKPLDFVDIKAGGEYSYCPDPELPVDYRSRLAGQIKAGVTPMPELNINAYYKLSREENPFDYPGQDHQRDRYVFKDTAGLTFTVIPTTWFSTSAYYNFDRRKVKNSVTWETQDIPPVLVFTEHYVSSRDTAHVYGITAATSFEFPVNFDLEFHQAISRGRYFTTAYNTAGGGFQAGDIDDMVNLRLHETGGSVTTMVDLPMGFEVDMTYEVNHFDDRGNNPQYLALDGTAHSGTFMVRKTW